MSFYFLKNKLDLSTKIFMYVCKQNTSYVLFFSHSIECHATFILLCYMYFVISYILLKSTHFIGRECINKTSEKEYTYTTTPTDFCFTGPLKHILTSMWVLESSLTYEVYNCRSIINQTQESCNIALRLRKLNVSSNEFDIHCIMF